MIKLNNKKYKVVEDLGYVHSRGCYAKAININGTEQIVIKINGIWKLAKPLIKRASNYKGA